MTTTGEFHTGLISSITVNRSERQRRELSDIPDLAESIARRGLINPILVTREMVLVAGERRLAACTSLGWTSIPFQFTDEIDPDELRALELEENTKRVDLPWQDNCRAVQEYHAFRRERDPAWTQEKTGEALGYSTQAITKFLMIAEEMSAGNEKVLAAPKISVARGIIERAQSRAKDAEIIASTPQTKVADILTGDFNEWVQTYDGQPFNLIHCDFPYGINIQQQNRQNAEGLHTTYDDSPDVYFTLLRTFLANIDKCCAPSAHIVFWYSEKFRDETKAALEKHFVLNQMPLIWHRSDNSGILPDPQRGPRWVYETAFFGSRGDRKIVSAVSNLFPCPHVSDLHVSEKPQAMLSHFFRMLVDGSTTLLDPTCGSGGALRAAEAHGAKSVLGLELNPEFAEVARNALAKQRAMK